MSEAHDGPTAGETLREVGTALGIDPAWLDAGPRLTLFTAKRLTRELEQSRASESRAWEALLDIAELLGAPLDAAQGFIVQAVAARLVPRPRRPQPTFDEVLLVLCDRLGPPLQTADGAQEPPALAWDVGRGKLTLLGRGRESGPRIGLALGAHTAEMIPWYANEGRVEESGPSVAQSVAAALRWLAGHGCILPTAVVYRLALAVLSARLGPPQCTGGSKGSQGEAYPTATWWLAPLDGPAAATLHLLERTTDVCLSASCGRTGGPLDRRYSFTGAADETPPDEALRKALAWLEGEGLAPAAAAAKGVR